MASVKLDAALPGALPGLSFAKLLALDGIAPQGARIQAHLVLRSNEGLGSWQRSAQMGQEPGQVAPGICLGGIRPEQQAQLGARDRPGLEGQVIQQAAHVATRHSERPTFPFDLGRAQQDDLQTTLFGNIACAPRHDEPAFFEKPLLLSLVRTHFWISNRLQARQFRQTFISLLTQKKGLRYLRAHPGVEK
jgi:hypothetical protein